MPTQNTPLTDSFGRRHTSLRVSVTDRCNIRCFYCMPAGEIQFQPKQELLTFEEITQFVSVASSLGIDSVRITGGEPLVRSELHVLIGQLAALPKIRDLSLTTNGILLDGHAEALRSAGLDRVNISLDTLDKKTFREITRREGLDRVIAGIDAAIGAGFSKVRVNSIAIRGITESEITGLVQFAADRQVELRFIEFMPLDAEGNWSSKDVLSGAEIRQQIQRRWGTLVPAPRENASQPAIDFVVPGTSIRVGFINPVSEPFCGDCNRLRLTAEGQIRNCLFSTEEWDARAILRGSADEAELAALIRDCVSNKRAGHGIDDPSFVPPQRAMYQIGG